MIEIRVVFPHPERSTTKSNSPQRASRSILRKTVTLGWHSPQVFVSPRPRTAIAALGSTHTLSESFAPRRILRAYLDVGVMGNDAVGERLGRTDVGHFILRTSSIATLALLVLFGQTFEFTAEYQRVDVRPLFKMIDAVR